MIHESFSMLHLPIIILTVLAVVAFFIFVSIFRSMWRVAEPDEALIISGLRHGKGADEKGFKIVTGSGTLVLPGVQTVRKLDLSMHEAALESVCNTIQGISVKVQGVAIYKVGDNPASIANAARRFLGQKRDDISRNIQNLFDGHLRSIIGGVTMEELLTNRTKLTDETRQAAAVDMEKLGLVIDSLQIKEITDPSNYIASIAAPHVAEIQKSARVAKARADQEATQAEQAADALKAQAERETQIKQASFQADVDKARAEAAQAGPLAAALAKQNVVRAETETADLEASRKEKELLIEVRKPADAQAYSITVKANADRDAAIAQAEASAKQIELQATAEANATRLRGQAEADANKAKGLAAADATRAQLTAEADGISARAEALSKNQDAVIKQTLVEHMGEIVKEAAAPFANIKNLTVLEGGEGLSRNISGIISSAVAVLPTISQGLQALKTGEPQSTDKVENAQDHTL
jgi:flotillin